MEAKLSIISEKPNIQIFHSEQFGEIRTEVSNPDNPLFCLVDICKALDLKNSRIVAQRLDEDELRKLDLPGRAGETYFVTESGMYDVVLRSDSPKAKPIRKWVTFEVLPSIRKQGGYMVSRTDDTNEEIMARALLIAQDAIKRKDERLRELSERVNQQDNALEMKDRFIEELQPDAEYTREVLKSESVFNATQIAKEFGWGAPTLNEKLRQLGVQYRQNGQWLLSYRYQNKDYTKTSTWTKEIGGIARTYHNTVWTEKGRKFIHELLSQKQAI